MLILKTDLDMDTLRAHQPTILLVMTVISIILIIIMSCDCYLHFVQDNYV